MRKFILKKIKFFLRVKEQMPMITEILTMNCSREKAGTGQQCIIIFLFQIQFRLRCLYPVTQLCSLKIFAYPFDINTASSPDHLLYFTVNNTPIASIYRNDFNRFDTTITFSSSLLSSSTVNTINALIMRMDMTVTLILIL